MTRTIVALLSALLVAAGFTLHMPVIIAPPNGTPITETPTVTATVAGAATGTSTSTGTATSTSTVTPTPTNTATATTTGTATQTGTATATGTTTNTPTETSTATATGTATDTPTATATATTAASGPCSCSGDLYNCTSFATHSQAQACFNYCVSQGAGDIHKLDQDNDGNACEGLPAVFERAIY
jgi:hypothetical protein